EGATGEATVILTLVVGEDGAVRSATAAEKNPPFSSSAERAALAWRFRPATRGGRPGAARIRIEGAFHPPNARPAPSEAEDAGTAGDGSATADAGADAQAIPQRVDEVRVRGAREEVAPVVSMGRAEVRQLPGAFGDPFRAIDALPG